MSLNWTLAIAVLAILVCDLAEAKSVRCSMDSMQRTVELHHETPGAGVPCEVRYAKPTEGVGEQVLWRAEREVGYCEARFEEFVDKLVGFGWSCAEVAVDPVDAWDDDVDSEPVSTESGTAESETAEADGADAAEAEVEPESAKADAAEEPATE